MSEGNGLPTGAGKGNGVGSKPTQWAKGQSGNPGGRPKGASITAPFLRALAANPDPETGIGEMAQAIGDRLAQALVSGGESTIDVSLLREAWNRADGMVLKEVRAHVIAEDRRILIVGTPDQVPQMPDGVQEIERLRDAAEEQAQIHRKEEE